MNSRYIEMFDILGLRDFLESKTVSSRREPGQILRHHGNGSPQHSRVESEPADMR